MEQAVPWMTIGYMVARELKASRSGRGRRWTLTAKRLAQLFMLLLGAHKANSVAVPTTPMETTSSPPFWGEYTGKIWVLLSMLMMATVASVNAMGTKQNMRNLPFVGIFRQGDQSGGEGQGDGTPAVRDEAGAPSRG